MTFFQGGTIGQFQYEFTSAVLVPKTRAAGFAYLVTQWNLLNINIYIKRYFVSFRTTTVEGYKAVSPFLADPTNRIRTEVWIQKQIDWINITPSMIISNSRAQSGETLNRGGYVHDMNRLEEFQTPRCNDHDQFWAERCRFSCCPSKLVASSRVWIPNLAD